MSVIAAHVGTSGGANVAGHIPLGQLLVEARMITHMQLADALVHQSESGGRIGKILFDQGVLGERDLAFALSEHLGIPLVDLSHTTPSTESSELLPEAIARRELAVPVGADEDGVTVAVADPTPEVTVALQNAATRPVRVAIAPRSDVQRAIDTAYRALGRIQSHVDAFELAEGPRRVVESATVAALTDDAPVVQVANLIVTQALRDRASDVHIEPQGTRLRVRYRIDGALHDALELPIAMAPALASRFKILAGMNIVERRRPQDGQFTIEIDGREIDVRVSTVTTISGECCVLRILDKGRALFRLAELGMPHDTNETIERFIRSPFGMILTNVTQRSASFHNLAAYPSAFPKDIFTDVAFIEASFGLSIAGAAC